MTSAVSARRDPSVWMSRSTSSSLMSVDPGEQPGSSGSTLDVR